MTIKYSNEEYKVEHYEDIPDSADLVDDITKNVRDNILSVLAKRIENNQNLGSGMSHALHTTLSATHTEICKVLNTLNAYKVAIDEAHVLDQKRKHEEASYF